MTNTTKNTTKSIFLALSVALTMSTASALSVPGLPSGVDFEFSKPGVESVSDLNQNGAGVTAITNITSILTAIGATGGTSIDQDHFWKAMVDPTERNVFDYGVAKKYIDELAFTVSGEYDAGGTLGWRVADAGVIATFTSEASTLGNGNKVDGNLKETRAGAVALLALLGRSVTQDATTHEVTITDDGTVSRQDVQASAISGSIGTAVTSAGISEKGFNNANKLIALIAEQLTTGFILDTSNVTASVDALAAQHNGFMAHSLVEKAKDIKQMIKYLGVQQAVVDVVQGANAVCTGAFDNNAPGCVTIGKKVVKLSAKLPAAGNSSVSEYKATLLAVNNFANQIISFNQTMGSFDSTIAAAGLDNQFGTITVDQNSQFYADLKGVTTGSGLQATTATAEDVLRDSTLSLGDILTSDQVIDREFAMVGDEADMFGTDFDDSLDLVITRTNALGVKSDTTETINLH